MLNLFQHVFFGACSSYPLQSTHKSVGFPLLSARRQTGLGLGLQMQEEISSTNFDFKKPQL
jgi:hypothetical protein